MNDQWFACITSEVVGKKERREEHECRRTCSTRWIAKKYICVQRWLLLHTDTPPIIRRKASGKKVCGGRTLDPFQAEGETNESRCPGLVSVQVRFQVSKIRAGLIGLGGGGVRI